MNFQVMHEMIKCKKKCFFENAYMYIYMKSSDAKASKCYLKFSCLMMISYQTCIFKFSNFT